MLVLGSLVRGECQSIGRRRIETIEMDCKKEEGKRGLGLGVHICSTPRIKRYTPDND